MREAKFEICLDADTEQTAASLFAKVGHVRVSNVFDQTSAKLLHTHLAEELAWSRVVNQGERVWDIGPESIQAMADGNDAPLIDAVNRGAREGFQFLFDSVRISDERFERLERGLLLDHLLEEMNCETNLSILRRIVGDDRISFVDGQATRYLPGHFLTGHDDDVAGKNRVAAYVINLTPHWRTEWGGLLQFHDQNGDVVRGLRPCFNAIH